MIELIVFLILISMLLGAIQFMVDQIMLLQQIIQFVVGKELANSFPNTIGRSKKLIDK